MTLPTLQQCGNLFAPDLRGSLLSGEKHKILPVLNAELLIIDPQVDFCNSTIGSLYVQGAVDDLTRLCNFIGSNISSLTRIHVSLDTHSLFQPFHSFSWVSGTNKGKHPDPFTLISFSDLITKKWIPTKYPDQMEKMLQDLASRNCSLCIWPLHCISGTIGHAIDPALMEVLHWYIGAYGCDETKVNYITKGTSLFSEHYGILKAEVPFDDDPSTKLNTDLLSSFEGVSRLYVAGEAKSHCVLCTLEQLAQFAHHLIDRVYVLEDCMSNVPGFDFPERFNVLKEKGMHFVNSEGIIMND